jgi:hypothetical protein
MPKVDYADLESVTKFLDKLTKQNVNEGIKKISKELSKMIKDKYTEIKPDYDRTD